MDAEASTDEQGAGIAGESRLRGAARKTIAGGFDAGAWIASRVPRPAPNRGRTPAAGSTPPEVIAHRGASAYAPENTLAAFRRAVAQSAREVELDVQLSRDDVLMVFHDGDLEAKTGGRGRIRDHDADTLRSLEVGSWFDGEHPGCSERFAGTPLNTLGEVFDAFGAALHYHVEIKASEEALPDCLLAEIGERGLRHRVTVTSFQSRPLLRVRKLDSELAICQLVRRVAELRDAAMDRSLLQDLRSRTLQRRAIERAAQRGFDQVALPVQQLSAAVVAHARELGLSIRAWRVRSLDDLDRALQLGLDGVTVDWPDRALARIAAAQSEASG